MGACVHAAPPLDEVKENDKETQDLCLVIIKDTSIKDIKKLWDIISDWGDLSHIKSVEELKLMNNDKVGVNEVGSIRELTLKDGNGKLIETILIIDHDNYKLQFSIDVHSPMLPVEYYTVCHQFYQETANDNVTWESTLQFNPKQGVTKKQAIEIVKGVILTVIQQIIDHCLTK